MAVIKPFRAIRPSKEYERIIPALPYDVYNRAEARQVVEKQPHSFLAIDRPETQFPEDFDMYSKEAYEKASSMLREWLDEGSFIQDDKPAYYIYELIMDGRSQTGIVGCASIDDYMNNVIKKHENTRADKELDRINHVDALSAQTGPIFLAYRATEAIDAIVNRIKAGACEICGSPAEYVCMHHVRTLKSLSGKDKFERKMLEIRRKSLALCPSCWDELQLTRSKG